ncbi:GTPase domain-containing protein, partial [Comamonas sp. B-9]|uniref:GTPase n=1 Tax=Comamonas sp. B-9 TaxID=1055192 RepID=UPI001EF9E936
MTEMTNAPPLPTAVPQAADAANDQTIAWCLLSHTNIGKTTLARTLVAEDIGEVQDAAHVTSQSQRYLLQRTEQGDELWLWDTPGFGDSVRLYNRLKQQGNPLGWFLSNVWDRWRDKPFYMSQRALQAARDHADVMLYLVNAAEDPADAGYWASEMRILQWMDKPVLVLLNQIGSDTTAAQTAADLQRWRAATAEFAGTVRSVQVLDAFTRSWWHEKQVMQSIAPLLPDAKQPAYQRLLQTRAQRQQAREAASLQALAEQLLLVATAQETVQASDNKLWQRAWNKVSGSVAQAIRGSGAEGAELSPEQTAAMQRLTQSLQQADLASTQALLALHQLDGQAASQIQQQLKDHLKTSTPLDPQTASLWGALTAGAATGPG